MGWKELKKIIKLKQKLEHEEHLRSTQSSHENNFCTIKWLLEVFNKIIRILTCRYCEKNKKDEIQK